MPKGQNYEAVEDTEVIKDNHNETVKENVLHTVFV